MSIRIAGVVDESVVDGPGLRFVIFCQGCFHNCRGCHNPETHDVNGGVEVQQDYLIKLIDDAPLIRGVTFSGGEPMLQADKLLCIARHVKNVREFDLVVYSGFVFEELIRIALTNPAIDELLKLTDYLIDGPYMDKERDLSIAFRGSRNQRIVDVRRSLETGNACTVEF